MSKIQILILAKKITFVLIFKKLDCSIDSLDNLAKNQIW